LLAKIGVLAMGVASVRAVREGGKPKVNKGRRNLASSIHLLVG
jgi:hypothetical protein